ncbi:MAG: hypothetical protein AAB074_19470 [Planctomycetota bacterium]
MRFALIALAATALSSCGPARPPEVSAADNLMNALLRDTGTSSLFAVPAISESIGRARQRHAAWLKSWEVTGVSASGRIGPWSSAEVAGTLTGTDGVARPAVVTLADLDRWQVLAVHVDGKLLLPCPLNAADVKKPQILFVRTRRQIGSTPPDPQRRDRLELEIIAAPGSRSSEAPAMRLEARLLEKDGAQHGVTFEADFTAPGVHGLVSVLTDPGWSGNFFPGRGHSSYRLAVTVIDKSTGESTTREEGLR